MPIRPLALALLLAAPAAHAQAFGALQQDARALVPSVEALGMGGAAAAVPTGESAFFTNPAHLARLDLRRPRITVFGAGASVSSDVFEKLAFYRDDLRPAIEEGLAEIRDEDYARLEALYDRALELGRQQSVAHAAVALPSVQLRVGPGALGAGVFAHNTTRLQFTEAGAGVPRVDFFDQLDVIVPVTAAYRVPNTPLAVGLAGTYAHRRLAAKDGVVDEFDPDDERLYVLSGSDFSVDAGLHAADVGVPGLDLGLTLHHALGGGYDLTHSRSYRLAGDSSTDDAAEIAALEARFGARNSGPTLRMGAAYRIPVPAAAGPLRQVTVAADYLGASTSEYDQTFGARLRLGTTVDVGSFARLRAGFAQGYPSFGAGLRSRFTELDYAFFGVEDGRTPGQFGRYNHLVQVRFGLF